VAIATRIGGRAAVAFIAPSPSPLAATESSEVV
jgi:hypothetical protein